MSVSATIYVGFIFISVVKRLTTLLTPFCTRKLTSVFKRERLDRMLLFVNILVTFDVGKSVHHYTIQLN